MGIALSFFFCCLSFPQCRMFTLQEIATLMHVGRVYHRYKIDQLQYRGRRMIGISGSLICSRALMKLIFNPCGEFRWSPEGPVNRDHSPHLYVGAPGIFFRYFKVCSDGKERVGWGTQRKASKTATLDPEFEVEDLPFERTANLVPAFAVRPPPFELSTLMITIS